MGNPLSRFMGKKSKKKSKEEEALSVDPVEENQRNVDDRLDNSVSDNSICNFFFKC